MVSRAAPPSRCSWLNMKKPGNLRAMVGWTNRRPKTGHNPV
jgi:hypothetical protein